MQFLTLVLTSSVLLAVVSCKLQFHGQSSKEQGLGAAIGDSAKGLAKLLTGVSDDVAKAARKLNDEGKFDDLAAIMAAGGRKADEAEEVFKTIAASKKTNLDYAVTDYEIANRPRLPTVEKGKRLEPYMHKVDAALEDYTILLKSIDAVSENLSDVSRDVFYKVFHSENIFEIRNFQFETINKIKRIARHSLNGEHSLANKIAEKGLHLDSLTSSIAGSERYHVRRFLTDVEVNISKADYDGFVKAIGNTLVRRSSGNFAERNFQEVKNTLTMLAKDKPHIIDNVRVTVKQQEDRLDVLPKYTDPDDMFYGMTAANKKQVLDFLDEIQP